MSDNKTKQVEIYSGNGFTVVQFKTGDLSIFSYYIESQGRAVLIDPTIQNDIYRDLETSRHTKIEVVLLTHIHADFLSGHLEFQGAKIYIGEGTQTNFNSSTLKDGQSFILGNIKIRALHTPGHTFESTCFILTDSEGVDKCIFTGDTLFLGGVGRPDLAVKGQFTKQKLGDMLFDSLQKIKTLNHEIKIYPGHGAGSSCGKSIGEGNHCFLKNQMEKNYALKSQSREDFVKEVCQISTPPKYFFYNARLNRQGPFSYKEQLQLANRPLSIQQYDAIRKNHAVILDIRDSQKQTEKGVIKGGIMIPAAARIANFAGSLFEGQQNILLFCQKQQIEEALQRLLRIGFINIKGYNNFTIQQWISSGGDHYIPKYATIQQLENAQNKLILDVRTLAEWKETGIFQNSVQVQYQLLENQIKTHPETFQNKEIYIHCRMGFRARMAASILEYNGVHNSYTLPYTFVSISKSKVKLIPYTT